MKKLIPLVFLVLFAGVVMAGNSTVSYTAAQSTQIQNRLIPLYNKRHCQAYNKTAGCSSADLVAGGCVVRVVKTVSVESCTIFTSDATGEQSFLQEMLNQQLVSKLTELTAQDADEFCTAFKAASTANQNSACSALGLPTVANGCAPCQ